MILDICANTSDCLNCDKLATVANILEEIFKKNYTFVKFCNEVSWISISFLVAVIARSFFF